MTKLLSVHDGILSARTGDLEPFSEEDVQLVRDDITILFRWKQSKIARTTIKGLLLAVQELDPTSVLVSKKVENKVASTVSPMKAKGILQGVKQNESEEKQTIIAQYNNRKNENQKNRSEELAGKSIGDHKDGSSKNLSSESNIVQKDSKIRSVTEESDKGEEMKCETAHLIKQKDITSMHNSGRITRSASGNLKNIPAKALLGKCNKTSVESRSVADVAETKTNTPKASLYELAEPLMHVRTRSQIKRKKENDLTIDQNHKKFKSNENWKTRQNVKELSNSNTLSSCQSPKVILDKSIEGIGCENSKVNGSSGQEILADSPEETFLPGDNSANKVSTSPVSKDINQKRSKSEMSNSDILMRKLTGNLSPEQKNFQIEHTSDEQNKVVSDTYIKNQFDLIDYLVINAPQDKRQRILELADLVSFDKSRVDNIPKKFSGRTAKKENQEDGDDGQEFLCKICNKRSPNYLRNSKEKEYHESCHAVLDGVPQTLLYKCPYCGVLVKGWGGFLNHAVKHEAALIELEGTSFLENIPFRCKCDECGKMFPNKKARDKHRSEAHSQQLVSCNVCKKKLFANKPKEVLRHLDICRNIIYRCDYCEYLTVVRADLRTHVNYHKENPICEFCHMGFPNKTMMENHKRNLHNWKETKKSNCPHCEEFFKDEHSLKKHIQVHHPNENMEVVQCPKCEFSASSEKCLKDHILVAHEKEYQCMQCSFGTDSEIAMEQHKQYHEENRKYPCIHEDCGFRAINVESLDKHIDSAHIDRKFLCPFCGKTFKKKNLLDSHISSHPTAKSYTCIQCKKVFNLFSEFHQHKEETKHDYQPGQPQTLPAYVALQSLESEEDQLVRLLVASVHVHKESEQQESRESSETALKLQETAYKIQSADNHLIVESGEVTSDSALMIASIPVNQGEKHDNDDTMEAASVLMDLFGKHVPDVSTTVDISTEKKPLRKGRKKSSKVTLVMDDMPNKGSKMFSCTYCRNRYFATEEDLEFHISSHVESEGIVVSDTYRCQICAKICTKWQRFIHHLAIHKNHYDALMKLEFMSEVLGEFKCDICNRVFLYSENLKLHNRSMHKGLKEYTICDVCGETIYSLDIREIDRHLDKCRNVLYRCDFCEYTTVYQNDMKSHSVYHSSGFKCKQCQVTFYSKSDLVKHQNAIHKDPPTPGKPTCQICGENYISKKALYSHMQENHADEVQWTNICDTCGFKAPTPAALIRHTKKAHPRIKMQCYMCKYKTFSEAALKKHMKEHEKKTKELICGMEGCTFSTFIKDHLRAHQKSVHAERDHICPVCGKGFKRKPALHRHIVNHPERKHYICGACNKTFTKFSSYETHKKETSHDVDRSVDEAAFVPTELITRPLTLKRSAPMPKKLKGEVAEDGSSISDQVIIQTTVNGQSVQYILKTEPGAEIQGEDLERSLRAIADLVQSGDATETEEVPVSESTADKEELGNTNTITYTTENLQEVLNAVVGGVSQFESSSIDIVPTVTDNESIPVIKTEENVEQVEQPTETVVTVQSIDSLLQAEETETSVEIPPDIPAPVSLLSPSRSTGRLEAVPSSSSYQRYIITGNQATSVIAQENDSAGIMKFTSLLNQPVSSETIAITEPSEASQTTIEGEESAVIFTGSEAVSGEPVFIEGENELADVGQVDAETLLSGVQGEGQSIELENGEKAVSHLVELPDGRQVVVVLAPAENSEPEAAMSMLQLQSGQN